MAQQAILAANRRRRNASSAAVNLGAGGAGEERDTTASLRLGLKAKAGMLYRLFSIWDENGDGAIDDMEFKRAVRMLGLRSAPDDFKKHFSA